MPTDILLDTDHYDLQYDANGEIVRGESTAQNQALLLMLNKGDVKESPLVCVGAYGYLKDENVQGLLAEIKSQFENDGMTVQQLNLTTDGQLQIAAPYE